MIAVVEAEQVTAAIAVAPIIVVQKQQVEAIKTIATKMCG
jgi:hypothetical protein